MSLPLIAKHLEQHGRGDDTHLVHMTTGELSAMQKLAEKHGGSLTVNPKTGLPEAGFLSAVLPMAIGAALDVASDGMLTPMTAGLMVGAGDYAMTGSLSQGLMAGLGAWGGAGMANSLEGTGLNAAVQQGGDTAAQQFQASQEQALNSSNAPGQWQNSLSPNATGVNTLPSETSANLAGNQISQMQNLSSDQIRNLQDALSVPGANAADVVRTAGMQNAALGAEASPWSTAGQGLYNSSGTGALNSLSNAGEFAKNNMVGVGMLGMAGLSALRQNQTVPGVQSTTNPMNMRTMALDSNGKPIFTPSIPAQPSPAYQAKYANYQQNPYVGNVETAASGGSMGLPDVKKYAGGNYDPYKDEISDAEQMMQGLQEATKRPVMQPLQPSDAGIYQLNNTDYANSMPIAILKKNKITVAKGLQPVGQLGEYTTTPVMQANAENAAQQDIANTSSSPGMKEGGLMAHRYSLGGLSDGLNSDVANQLALIMGANNQTQNTPTATIQPYQVPQNSPVSQIYQPVYPNYQLNPINNTSSANQQYLQNIPTPHRGQGHAAGGPIEGHLGSYSDGGRLLKGPGDGVSDGIPATIGGKQPARLADGEFVIPARIVSELGNGSTDAGAKRLYAMMDRIKKARSKSKDIAADTKTYKYLPA